MDVEIERLSELPIAALTPLITESEREGWKFVRRLVDDWIAGVNRFDKPGETFFVARVGTKIVGTCGLNVDPYSTEKRIGRVRRLYVAHEYRGHRIGRRLVEAVIAAAVPRFQSLHVRTENSQAARLYKRLGFRHTAEIADCTHTLELASVSSDALLQQRH